MYTHTHTLFDFKMNKYMQKKNRNLHDLHFHSILEKNKK